ncbi:MAG: MFS transporter [Proteobacteria bacterium]|nr:MFS transporter [Pseudomonadota bacterium]
MSPGPHSGPPAQARESGAVGRGVLIAYSLPMAGYMMLSIPFSIYLVKFGTDSLLIAPATIATIYGIGRLWDAVSDPLAGYLSDRTRARSGRRRSWMRASALPVALTFYMLWSPPAGLEIPGLILWMAAAILLYETAQTAFIVPYTAWGMELTSGYHERTRVFGYRHVIGACGYGLGLACVYLLRRAEEEPWLAGAASLAAGGVFAAAILFAASRVPERQDYQGRGGVNLWRAFQDVFANPHARLILLVYAIESFGAASIGGLSPYIVEYVIGVEDLLELLLLFWIVPQFIFTPLWLALSRRIGKKRLWMLGMGILSLAFGGNMALGPGTVALVLSLVFALGLGTGIAGVVVYALKADVVDYDEMLTGERKEGAYAAVWNFIRKAGGGISIILAGYLLQRSGFVPNAEQTSTVRWTILSLAGGFPAVTYAIGLFLFRRYSLNEAEHAVVVEQLRRRGPPGTESQTDGNGHPREDER